MSLSFVTASSQKVALPTSLSSLQNVPGATGCAWVRPTSLVSSGSRSILSLSINTAGSTSRFAMEQISGDWQGIARRLDGDGATIAAGGTPAVSTLQHVAVVANFTGGDLRLYLDGVLVTTTANGGWTANSSNTTSANSHIGAEDDGNSSYFDGIIDDLRLYARALSATEIGNIYQARGSDRIVDGLVNHWTMGEGAPGVVASGASVIRDIAAGQAHGTPAASPTWAEEIVKSRSRRAA